MNTQGRLEQAIGTFRLSDSRFYEAWSCGELPIKGLKLYGEEYGALVRLLPLGWEVQGDTETAHEEEEHIELWEKFCKGLETEICKPAIKEVETLVDTTKKLFSDRVSALGALYAFESQQPETAQSKLDGLRRHYENLPVGDVEPYFEAHSHNHHEAEKILNRLSELSEDDLKKAVDSCGQMAKALFQALDGIYDSSVKPVA